MFISSAAFAALTSAVKIQLIMDKIPNVNTKYNAYYTGKYYKNNNNINMLKYSFVCLPQNISTKKTNVKIKNG